MMFSVYTIIFSSSVNNISIQKETLQIFWRNHLTEMSAQPLLSLIPITNNGDEKLGDNTTFFLQDVQGLVETTWVGELFPIVSFSILSLCFFSSQHVCAKCLLHMFGICIHWFLESFSRPICWCQWMVAMPTADCRSQLLSGTRAQIWLLRLII